MKKSSRKTGIGRASIYWSILLMIAGVLMCTYYAPILGMPTGTESFLSFIIPPGLLMLNTIELEAECGNRLEPDTDIFFRSMGRV